MIGYVLLGIAGVVVGVFGTLWYITKEFRKHFRW
jgi:hypothetical protein